MPLAIVALRVELPRSVRRCSGIENFRNGAGMLAAESLQTMPISIVPITEDHIEGFWAAVDSIARERRYTAWFEAPPIESTRAYVRQHIRDQRPHVVALDGLAVVGYCDIAAMSRPAYAHAGILGIGVIDGYRDRGVGRALILAVIEQAKAIGLTRIELTVRENNDRAIALYEKMGFEREGTLRNAVRVDGHYFNKVIMSLLLPEDVTHMG
jgi:ribosomal protein S18 acetylase RimI-like enzyme